MLARLRLAARSAGSLALIVAVAYAGFALARLAALDWDASRFVVAGDRYVSAAAAPAGLTILADSSGYDGQFYYRLALAPFCFEETTHGIRLDRPAYRQQRILYPLAVFMLAHGRPEPTAWLLITLNLVGVVLLGWCAGDVCRSFGRNPAWGLAIAFYPGYLLSISRDLPEACASALALLAIGRWRGGRPLAASACFVLASLCRETTLLIPCGLALFELARARRQGAWRDGLVLLAPGLVYIGWQLALFFGWGELGLVARSANFGPPLLGPGRFLSASWPPLLPVQKLGLMQASLIAGGLATVGASALLRRGEPAFRLLWGAYVVLFLLLSPEVWIEDYGFMRAYTECHLLGCLVLLSDTARRLPLAALGLGVGRRGWPCCR